MRPPSAVTPDGAAFLDAWAAHIDFLLDTQWDLMEGGHRWTPAEMSPLQQVRSRLRQKFGPRGDWNGDEAETAGRLATLMLAVSGQHLEAIHTLLIARQVVFPIAPLTRAVVELAGRTFWLIDPRVSDARDLAARVWMNRLEDVNRQVRTAKGWPDENQKVIEKYVLRKKLIRNVEIPSRFYESEIANDDGEITLRGQHSPGLGGSLKHIAAGMGIEDFHTPMYSFLSDATHPTVYPVIETLQARGRSGADDLHSFGSADMRREYTILQSAVHAYQQAWLVTTSYFGLDDVPVREACEKVVDLPHGVDVGD